MGYFWTKGTIPNSSSFWFFYEVAILVKVWFWVINISETRKCGKKIVTQKRIYSYKVKKMASIACRDGIHKRFSKHFYLKYVSEFFWVLEKICRWRFYSKHLSWERNQCSNTGLINMILNLIESKTLLLLKVISFKHISHSNHQKCP